jgi:hypothetical protein
LLYHSRKQNRRMDCRGAARLAMTKWETSAECPTLVIARAEGPRQSRRSSGLSLDVPGHCAIAWIATALRASGACLLQGANPRPRWLFVVFTRFEGGAASPSNPSRGASPNQPVKKQGFTF